MPPTINTIITISTSISLRRKLRRQVLPAEKTQKPERFGLLRRELRAKLGDAKNTKTTTLRIVASRTASPSFARSKKHKNRDVWNCCGQFVIANCTITF